MYTDISRSATVRLKHLQVNSWYLASTNTLQQELPTSEPSSLISKPFSEVRIKYLCTFCISRCRSAFLELWVWCSNDSALNMSTLRRRSSHIGIVELSKNYLPKKARGSGGVTGEVFQTFLKALIPKLYKLLSPCRQICKTKLFILRRNHGLNNTYHSIKRKKTKDWACFRR